MVVVAALAVVLVMSISVSKGQYELVGLKNQQQTCTRSTSHCEQDIAAKQAPQELVAQAAALGMVPAGTTGQIDVRTKKVSGSPQPASADTKGLVVIPPALDRHAGRPPCPWPAPRPLSPATRTSVQPEANESPEGKRFRTSPCGRCDSGTQRRHHPGPAREGRLGFNAQANITSGGIAAPTAISARNGSSGTETRPVSTRCNCTTTE